MHDRNDLSLDDLRDIALEALADRPDGAALSALEAALVELGVATSVTSLDNDAAELAIARAFAAGASAAQVQEVVSLVSGLGVHSLMVTAPMIVAAARTAGEPVDAPLTPEQQALWAARVGDDPFWAGFERELPGFLDALLRLSSDQFAAFFDYCAVPWRSGSVRARIKELIAMACDATPAHRFLPGFRIHLRNAIELGAGRAAVLGALDIAAAAPAHRGTR